VEEEEEMLKEEDQHNQRTFQDLNAPRMLMLATTTKFQRNHNLLGLLVLFGVVNNNNNNNNNNNHPLLHLGRLSRPLQNMKKLKGKDNPLPGPLFLFALPFCYIASRVIFLLLIPPSY
jgi:hypothetical protein